MSHDLEVSHRRHVCTVHSAEQKSIGLKFPSPEPGVTCGTVATIIRVVLFSPYLRIRGVSLSSIHYNQSPAYILTEDNDTFA